MRRPVAVALLVILVALIGSPASAKDPFQPLVREPGQQSEPVSTEPIVVDTSESARASTSGPALPLTGIYADLWFGGAVILMLLGTAILILERTYRLIFDHTRVFRSAQ